MALAPVAPRLARLLRLLASDQDGEVIAAACAIGRTLKSVALDFHDLARAVEGHEVVEPAPSDDGEWAEKIGWLVRERKRFLRSKDIEFLNDMLGWSDEPTVRQAEWVDRIYWRERRRAL